RRSGPTTFRALTGHLVERLAVNVRFLAVLELYKQGLVELDQGESFGELHVLWVGGDLEAEVSELSADGGPPEGPGGGGTGEPAGLAVAE
ncbi:MAG TPA: segregation/condensation protein A, partial [Acidimicrobiales bacterium]|nr:segregation/condensation protein A [Acidimicrobiales bacterium]